MLGANLNSALGQVLRCLYKILASYRVLLTTVLIPGLKALGFALPTYLELFTACPTLPRDPSKRLVFFLSMALCFMVSKATTAKFKVSDLVYNFSTSSKTSIL